MYLRFSCNKVQHVWCIRLICLYGVIGKQIVKLGVYRPNLQFISIERCLMAIRSKRCLLATRSTYFKWPHHLPNAANRNSETLPIYYGCNQLFISFFNPGIFRENAPLFCSSINICISGNEESIIHAFNIHSVWFSSDFCRRVCRTNRLRFRLKMKWNGEAEKWEIKSRIMRYRKPYKHEHA